jgi:Ca-activated chloride channel homolog
MQGFSNGCCVRTLRAQAALTVGIVCAWSLATAQEPVHTPTRVLPRRGELREGPAASLRTDVNRVLIPVTVTDTYGRQVQGLRKQDFRLLEDGVEQTILEFFVDEEPLSVGIVLDASNSMTAKIDPAKQAISAFLRLSAPEDEFFLVTVQDRPELAQAFTCDPAEIEHEMAGVHAQGWTALYDGMYLGINHLKRSIHSRRALVVLTDGGDNNSRYTESEMRTLVRESDARIFSISVLGRSPAMERLAEESGGQAFHIHKLSELSDLGAALNAAIHDEYVLGFSPANHVRDGKYHTTRVEIVQPTDGSRLHAAWRHGYYAPFQ